MSNFRVISDAPAVWGHDQLNFTRYIEPIISILTDPNAETPFTIGIFGNWGSGKSTLLHMVDDRLCEEYPSQFVRVHFNPWVHRSESNILIPLLHTLNDALETEESRFLTAAANVGKVLLALGSDILLKKLTADTLSLEKLGTVKKTIMEETGIVESEMRKLHKTLQGVANTVHEGGAKLVFFIDDLDRCQPEQIIDVLESMKLFLDLEHTFILLAVDKEVIDRGVQVKYDKFKFAERGAVVGAEYLEKMVQLPLSLYPLESTQVETYVNSLQPSNLVQDQIGLLKHILPANPRKIKRILNILNVTDSIASATPGLNLKLDLVARLVVIQVQSASLYQDVLKVPDLLVALEGLYTGKRKINQQLDFQDFLELRDVIQDLSKKYYEPDSYLARLFAESTFQDERANLGSYLSMLGG